MITFLFIASNLWKDFHGITACRKGTSTCSQTMFNAEKSLLMALLKDMWRGGGGIDFTKRKRILLYLLFFDWIFSIFNATLVKARNIDKKKICEDWFKHKGHVFLEVLLLVCGDYESICGNKNTFLKTEKEAGCLVGRVVSEGEERRHVFQFQMVCSNNGNISI